jgi:hypothetical protein
METLDPGVVSKSVFYGMKTLKMFIEPVPQFFSTTGLTCFWFRNINFYKNSPIFFRALRN